jgi:hypothetical protein
MASWRCASSYSLQKEIKKINRIHLLHLDFFAPKKVAYSRAEVAAKQAAGLENAFGGLSDFVKPSMESKASTGGDTQYGVYSIYDTVGSSQSEREGRFGVRGDCEECKLDFDYDLSYLSKVPRAALMNQFRAKAAGQIASEAETKKLRGYNEVAAFLAKPMPIGTDTVFGQEIPVYPDIFQMPEIKKFMADNPNEAFIVAIFHGSVRNVEDPNERSSNRNGFNPVFKGGRHLKTQNTEYVDGVKIDTYLQTNVIPNHIELHIIPGLQMRYHGKPDENLIQPSFGVSALAGINMKQAVDFYFTEIKPPVFKEIKWKPRGGVASFTVKGGQYKTALSTAVINDKLKKASEQTTGTTAETLAKVLQEVRNKAEEK